MIVGCALRDPRRRRTDTARLDSDGRPDTVRLSPGDYDAFVRLEATSPLHDVATNVTPAPDRRHYEIGPPAQ